MTGARSHARSPAIALAAALLFAAIAQAQPRVPSAERPELAPPEEPPPAALELPPIPPPGPAERDQLSAGLAVFVEAFVFEGNTAFGDDELAAATREFTGRTIRSEELLAARDAVTRLYVAAGYATSGAVIPDQSTASGRLRIRVIEGVVTEISVGGTRWFEPGYFRSRLARAARAPANVHRIERELRLLSASPLVEQVHARLEAGARRGESRLRVRVVEARSYDAEFGYANGYSPAIGAHGPHGRAWYANLAGWGDRLEGSIDDSEGLRDYAARYTLPVGPWDTTLGASFRHSRGELVEPPFDVLDVLSRSTTVGLELEHPLLRRPGHFLWLGLRAEYRESRTAFEALEAIGFCPTPSADSDCEIRVAALRPYLSWTRQTARSAVALRSTLSVGVDALDATSVSGGAPDGQFVAWLAQIQGAVRLPERFAAAQLLARFDLQLAGRSLLSIEKFAVGGHRTVRGYRTNQLVRDQGVVGSLEARIPVWRTPLGRAVAELTPFFDGGAAWDHGVPRSDPIASLGIGLRLSPWPWLRGEISWGGRLIRARPRGTGLQGEGLHLRVTLGAVDALAAAVEQIGR